MIRTTGSCGRGIFLGRARVRHRRGMVVRGLFKRVGPTIARRLPTYRLYGILAGIKPPSSVIVPIQGCLDIS